MKAYWHAVASKLDEMSLRERGLVFIAAAVLLVMLVHALALQPLLRQQRAYLDRIRQGESQFQSISEAVLKKTLAERDHPLVAKRQKLQELDRQLADSEKRLAERRNLEMTPAQLATLLRDALGGGASVQLAALRVTPATPVASSPAASGQFYRHGVEIELAGPYLDLLRYMERLERLPWRLQWSGIELKTTAYPEVVLRATLFAVSSSPTLIKL